MKGFKMETKHLHLNFCDVSASGGIETVCFTVAAAIMFNNSIQKKRSSTVPKSLLLEFRIS